MLNTISHGARRASWIRRIAPLLAGLAVLSVVAVTLASQSGWGPSAAPSPRHSSRNAIAIDWPAQGQAALSVGGREYRSSPSATQRPIASLAKVMTAYVVLRRDPLPGDSDGFILTFGEDDVAMAARDKDDGQSYVPVEPGETMTQREALEALLLPSANNIAVALAIHEAGTVLDFVEDMNATAVQLGMRHTTYTDPSGFEPSTVSTAVDQLRLARAAMRIPAFAAIVGMRAAEIPVAGPVTNTDTLIGRDGFIGIKTGSDQAAGGCFMFESVRRMRGHVRRFYGVVLGQTGGPLVRAGLESADALVVDMSQQLK